MSSKNLYLIAAIITTLVFIGYMIEPGPHVLFGYSINIWIVRIAWLLIAVTNFVQYFKLRKAEKS